MKVFFVVPLFPRSLTPAARQNNQWPVPAGSVAIAGGKLNRVAEMMVNICELIGFVSVRYLEREGTKFVSKSDMALMRLQLLTWKKEKMITKFSTVGPLKVKVDDNKYVRVKLTNL